MKREIKFRAWDGKQMHLPEYSDKEDFHLLPDGTVVETHEHGYERYQLTSKRSEDWIVMQYIGLRDASGKEIYESDIVQFGQELPILIEWDNQYSSFALKRKGWAFSHFFGEACEPHQVRVIGNKYENTEMVS